MKNLALGLLTLSLFAADTTLIPAGATWKYKDDGSNQGTAWRTTAFDDAAWAAGPAELGYGDGGEATVVSYGPDANNKFITTYFRRSFSVPNPAAFTSLILNLVRDDGAVIYLNGTEVWRVNMPTGTVSHTTLATAAVADETAWQTTSISPALLVAGANVIAVEIHQSAGTSSDISFNFSLIGTDTVSVTRGPYLQLGTHDAMTVRWRTNIATDSRVAYGTTQGALSSTANDSTLTTEHEIRLTGLLPDTRYFYSIGSTTATLSGNDAATYFYTNPAPGTVRPYRFWVIGDAGTGNTQQVNVRNSYTTYNGGGRTDAWLMLGDNAYNNGTDSEYQSFVYNIYPSVFRNVVLWPALGNHDTAQSTTPPPTLPYFQMFTLPTQAEAGGVASNTEKYYSFDYGNVHFIALDSMASPRATGQAMANWLQSDLAANTRRWTIAYWHHPPYSKGTHNSDTETELVEMRQYINPILESGKIDLVLAGHSHSYERSYLLDSHYGVSSTLTSAMKIDGGPGPYTKAGVNGHEGAVYVVAGSSGRLGSLMNPTHPAMYSSRTEAGSLVIDVNGDRMDVRFLTEAGAIADSFYITKGVAPPAPPNAPSGLAVTTASSTQINLNWTDNSGNESGFRIERSTDGSTFSPLTSVGAGVTTYSNTGLTASTLYYYRVLAFNAAGDSAFSNIASATTSPAVATTFVAAGAVWRYLDNGSNQGTSWRSLTFNDASWKVGAAQLGYGDGDEATVVSYGNKPNNKYITTYFRHSFSVANPSEIAGLLLSLVRDDGAVVYLNGTEVFRSNMPAGSIGHKTLASTAVDGANESAWFSTNVSPSLIRAGTNVIAVEIHQSANNSSDISFNLRLTTP